MNAKFCRIVRTSLITTYLIRIQLIWLFMMIEHVSIVWIALPSRSAMRPVNDRFVAFTTAISFLDSLIFDDSILTTLKPHQPSLHSLIGPTVRPR
jgi:hypothetical protein